MSIQPDYQDPLPEAPMQDRRRKPKSVGVKFAKTPRGAVTTITKAGTTAAAKVTEAAGTATEIAKAMGIGVAGIVAHSRAFRAACKQPLEALIDAKDSGGTKPDQWVLVTAEATSGALLQLEDALSSYADLPLPLKDKFRRAGLRGATRVTVDANEFYVESVPLVIRKLGEGAVRRFTKGKDASHIKSVAKAPDKMTEVDNIIWECLFKNRKRGAADMTRSELRTATRLNALDATGIVFSTALKTAAVSACMGMVREGVVSVTENVIYVYKDQMTPQEARTKVMADVLKEGKTAAIGGAGMTVVIALGAGPTLAAAAPALMTVGGVLSVVTTYKRIKTALDSQDDQPDQHPLVPSSSSLRAA